MAGPLEAVLKSILLLTLITVSVDSSEAITRNRNGKASSSLRMPALRNIDRVELMSIQSRMGGIDKVDETRTVEGGQAQEIARIWRKQRFQGHSSAACHQPPYAIKFYSRGKVILFATVCWMCHNVNFIVPDVKHWVTFAAECREAAMLKEIFQRAFPSGNKVGLMIGSEPIQSGSEALASNLSIPSA